MSENKNSQYKEENKSTPSRPLEYKERTNESQSTSQMLRAFSNIRVDIVNKILHIKL